MHGHLGWCGGLENAESWVRYCESLFVTNNLQNVRARRIQIGSRIGPRTSVPIRRGVLHTPAREKGPVRCTAQSLVIGDRSLPHISRSNLNPALARVPYNVVVKT